MLKSRRRGHDYERDTAEWYRTCGFPARRGLQPQGGETAPDVIVEDMPIHIECKYAAKGYQPVLLAYRQAAGDAADGTIPVVHVHQSHSKEHLVVLDREDWIELLRLLRENAK